MKRKLRYFLYLTPYEKRLHEKIPFLRKGITVSGDRLLRFSECAHRRNAIKLSEICGDSFCDKVSQVAQDSQVSQVPRMR